MDSRILQLISGSKIYQYRTFIILSILWYSQCVYLMSATYIYITPPLYCNGELCYQSQYYCQKYTLYFDPQYHYSNIVTDYYLICDYEIYTSIIPSLVFLSCIFGSLFFSKLGDRKGRKFSLFISAVITLLGFLLLIISPNLPILIIAQIIIGFSINGVSNISFVILNEICDDQTRSKLTIRLLLVFGLSQMITALSFYLIPNWRIVFIVFIVFPQLIGVILCIYVYETPTYHLAKQNIVKVSNRMFRQSLLQIAEINKVNSSQEIIKCTTNTNTNTNTQVSKYKFRHLFTIKSFRYQTIGMLTSTIILYLLYYFTQIGISSISQGNALYIIAAFQGLSEALTNLFISGKIANLRRKQTAAISFILLILFSSMFALFGVHFKAIDIPPNQLISFKSITILIFCCALRICYCVAYAILRQQSIEVYPASIRSIGSGFIFSLGMLGSFLSPYLFEVSRRTDTNPFLLIAILFIICPFMNTLVKETLGQPLLQDVNDYEQIQL